MLLAGGVSCCIMDVSEEGLILDSDDDAGGCLHCHFN